MRWEYVSLLRRMGATSAAMLSLKEVEKEGRTNSHHVKTKIFNSTLQHRPRSEGVKRKEGVEAC